MHRFAPPIRKCFQSFIPIRPRKEAERFRPERFPCIHRPVIAISDDVEFLQPAAAELKLKTPEHPSGSQKADHQTSAAFGIIDLDQVFRPKTILRFRFIRLRAADCITDIIRVQPEVPVPRPPRATAARHAPSLQIEMQTAAGKAQKIVSVSSPISPAKTAAAEPRAGINQFQMHRHPVRFHPALFFQS